MGFQVSSLEQFLHEKKDLLSSVFKCEILSVQKLSGLLQERLRDLTCYTRPGVFGDRRCMKDISNVSPLDCADGPEVRESLICDVVRLGSTCGPRPSLREFAHSVVRGISFRR